MVDMVDMRQCFVQGMDYLARFSSLVYKRSGICGLIVDCVLNVEC